MNEEHSEPAAKKRRKDAEKVVPTGKDNGPPEERPAQRYEDTAKDKSITPEQLGGMLDKIADAVNGILEKAREQIAGWYFIVSDVFVSMYLKKSSQKVLFLYLE